MSSCSKFGRLPASGKGFTNVVFAGGGNGRGLRESGGGVNRVGPPQDGGVVIWGVKSDGGSAFSLLLENDSELAAKDHIPNGTWNFYAVGWTDATNNFEGAARCATASAELSGTNATVTLSLTPGACTDAAFGASGFFNAGSPLPLRFIRCKTLPDPVDGTQICDGTPSVGDFQSFRVSVVEHEIGPLGTADASPERLTSRCFYPALSGTSSVGNSAILLPAASGLNRFEHVRFTEMGGVMNSAFITINEGNGNRFSDLLLSHLQQSTSSSITSGFRINTGDSNVISNAVISNIQEGPSNVSTAGIYLGSGAANNVLSQVTVFGTGDAGIVLSQADSNVIQYATLSNNTYNGVYLSGSGVTGNFFRGLSIANTSKGFEAAAGITGSGNVLKDSASGNNTTYAVDLSQGSGYINVLGYLAVQGTCAVGNTITNSACTHSSISAISTDFTSAYLGKVVSDDNQNASDVTGAQNFASITDWAGFQGPRRAWGKEGAPDAFPSANLRGACVTGTCRIWDWSAQSGGALYNKSFDGSTTNPAFTTGACPVNGNDTESVRGGSNNALKHAVELVDDGKGNDDGLCESNEVCVHVPHIGAHQGSGNFTSPCAFTNGLLSNITLVEYSTL